MKSEYATFLHIFPPECFGDSIKLGAFLEKLKLAKVTPIFKSRKKQTLNKLQTNISFALFFKDTRKDYNRKQ